MFANSQLDVLYEQINIDTLSVSIKIQLVVVYIIVLNSTF